MISLRLQRRHTTADLYGYTPGELYIPYDSQERFCYTLEDELREVKVHGETAIPAGTYKVILENSPKFGPNTLTLVDVPEFSKIRMHALNDESETEGCIGVGEVLSANKILHSRDALKRLKDALIPALLSDEEVNIHIFNARGDVYVDSGNSVPNQA